jgi:ubiquinol-cytochrome c reductase cytochrome b subunit
MATTRTPETPRGLQPPDKKPVRISVPEERKAPRYGDPFFPKVPFQAIFYILAIFGVLIFLALTNPAPLQDPADPLNHALIDPRPEWYFMFLFELLRIFQGPLIPLGTVIIPTIVVLLLLGLPFYDRNWARKASRRPVAMVAMSGSMLAVLILLWGGFGFPTPAFNTTSSVATGTISFKNDVQTIFSAHCSACHLNGVASGGLNLSSYAGLEKGGSVVPGPVFKPGNHKASVIWQITQPNAPWPGGNRMPLGGPYLTPAEEATIANWIDQGAKNN